VTVGASPPLTERQALIVERVARTGFVTIEGLAEEFGLSAQTIRRDIIRLSQTGRLQRFHGGAGVAEAARLDHKTKRNIAQAEKKAVGRAAAALVPDGAALYLDVGTTIEACAEELASRPGFRIFTNSMRAAMMFDPAEHDVRVLGGRMAGRDGSLVGEGVVLELQGIRLDVALIACSAVDDAGRVMDFDLSKIAVKRAALAAAGRSILVATASKFGRTALATIAHLDRFDQVASSGG
jgi:DeoR family glycerol-3-phosphate regulon repressor